MQRAEPRGFTLVEVAVVLLVIAVLAAAAAPSFRAQWLKARRGDAQVALMRLQQHQERWRAEHPAYATATELAVPDTSPQGHYRLSVADAGPHGYELRADALGSQRGDVRCRQLALEQRDGDTRWRSAGDGGTRNNDAANRGCWGR